MKCPKCQFENAEGIKFCGECGNKLDIPAETSPNDLSFDEKIAKIQKYLPKGLTEKILSQKDRIEGERKQVTVMFCDMEGYTPLVEALGPEAVYSVMDQVYEILIHQVHDFEGTVNEMTGDGIMALFGAPIALEDAPHRALRSALCIHSEIEKFNEQKKVTVPIKMRIGVHTGPVVLGTLGNDLRVEFKAVGDTVNLASRMEGLAEPGSTCVTADTYKLTEGLFRFEAMGEKAVKGKKAPVTVYKLISSKKDTYRPRLGLERSIYSEMVGRDRELDQIELQVLKAVNGEGSIVNIIGEAGIGKSRLVAELKNRDVIKRVSLFEGRATSTGRNLSFHPIIDLLKHWAQISEDDGEATTLSKLEIAVRRVVPEEVHEVLPFVATLMGMRLTDRYAERVKGIEGEALEKLILKNMRDLLIKATELNPLVIVVEDLHWADMSSIELLESLFRLVETQRVVFINVFRPGYKETGDRVVGTIKEKYLDHYAGIDLQPLDARMSEALINNMLKIKGLKHAVIDQIVERADGNPFFIEEVVQSFIDQGAVVAKRGAFEVTEKIDTLVIPNTINDVLMARIDQLEEDTRNLVKIASVIGRNFFHRILTNVAATVENIDNRISYLKEIQLIHERKRMKELEYLFKHALAQEAAYESILEKKRKELHLKVADSIENIFNKRLHKFYGMLAYHYSKGEDYEKAEEYMIKAGEEALRSSASTEALNYYQQSLNLYIRNQEEQVDPEKLGMFEKNIAIAYHNKGLYTQGIKHFDKALEYLGEKSFKSNNIKYFMALLGLGSFLKEIYFKSKKEKALPSEKERERIDLHILLLSELGNVNPSRFLLDGFIFIKTLLKYDVRLLENGVRVFLLGSMIITFTGFFKFLSRKMIDFSGRYVNDKDVISLIGYPLCRIQFNLIHGEWDTEYDDEIVLRGLQAGEIQYVSLYLSNHVLMLIEKGDFYNVRKLTRRLYDILKEHENTQTKIDYYEVRTKFLLKTKRFVEALSQVDISLRGSKVAGQDLMTVYLLGMKAQIQSLIGEDASAEQSLTEARELINSIGFIPPHYLIRYRMARLIFDIKKLEEAAKAADRMQIRKYRSKLKKNSRKAVIVSRKWVWDKVEAHRLRGKYYSLIGKQRKARKWWIKSIAEGEKLGAHLELSRTYMEVGKWLLEPESKYKGLSGIKAEEYLSKAKVMFKEMDLQWDLDELDKVTSTV